MEEPYYMKHLLDSSELSYEQINELVGLAGDIMLSPSKYSKVCSGKILATLFYEASTRTRLSFESAMISLGGSVIGFSTSDSSSAVKGESIADTIRTVSEYADIAVIRHPKEGSALVASQYSKIPVVNAGDGGHSHPTQTLTDILTIVSSKGNLENLSIGLCGDLMFGRTVHSLVKSLSSYPNNKFIFISPEELKIPSYLIDQYLNPNKIEYVQTTDLEGSMPQLDILYMTRVQRERFFNEEDYIRLKDLYILDKNKLRGSKEGLVIMHPLPRVNEISKEVDDDPRAKYFDQVKYGKYIRMALIIKMLGVTINA
jgi:aspartate carbamoyltransferase catalytic subunit